MDQEIDTLLKDVKKYTTLRKLKLWVGAYDDLVFNIRELRRKMGDDHLKRSSNIDDVIVAVGNFKK